MTAKLNYSWLTFIVSVVVPIVIFGIGTCILAAGGTVHDEAFQLTMLVGLMGVPPILFLVGICLSIFGVIKKRAVQLL